MQLQDLLLRFYDYRPFPNAFLNKISGNTSKLLLIISRLILPIYFKLTQRNKSHKQINAIGVLTSFPQRINVVPLVIECLIRQTYELKNIVLYLSKKQFQYKKELPQALIQLEEEKKIIIKFVDEDIKSHKKYWYAITDFPDTDIITFDDDIIYTSKIVEKLFKAIQNTPRHVASEYCQRISYNGIGEAHPYSLWSYTEIKKGEKGKDLFFGTGGGTYFPFESLRGANISHQKLMDICPLADDLWLNAIIRMNDFSVINIGTKLSVPEWNIPNNKKLSTINNGENLNDKQMSRIISFLTQKGEKNPFTNHNKQ